LLLCSFQHLIEAVNRLQQLLLLLLLQVVLQEAR
jgi:hypothetical protein